MQVENVGVTSTTAQPIPSTDPSASHTPPINQPQYRRSLNYIAGQTSLDHTMMQNPKPNSTLTLRMPTPEPIASIPHSANISTANELATFVPPYYSIAHSTPLVPLMVTGSPYGLVPFGHQPQHAPQPGPHRSLSLSMTNMMATLKDEMNKQFKEITGVDLKLRDRT